MLCFLFCLSSSCVLCTKSCQFLSIGHSWFSLRFSLAFIYRYIVCKWGKWIKQKGTEISVNSLWSFHFTTCFCLNYVRRLHLLVTILPDKAWVSFYDFAIDLALYNLNQFNSLDIKKTTTSLLWKTCMTASFHYERRFGIKRQCCLIQPLSTHFCFFYLPLFDYT